MTGAGSPPSVGLLSRIDSPTRFLGGRGESTGVVQEFEEAWQRGGAPSLDDHWSGQASTDSITTLAALVKTELRWRYARGERPAIAEYLERFPGLRGVKDRVVSLVYEEYCLREEQGETLDPDQFCARYDPWRDSLVSQLRYHRLLSQVVAPPSSAPRFPEPGEQFQGFRLQTVLGRGGVARVYLATEPEVGDREVALKVSPDQGKEPSIQGRLDHAHIVPVLSVTARDPETGLRGLCMPYRSGCSLDEVIRWVDPASQPRRAKAIWNALAPQGRTEWELGPKDRGWQGFPIKGTYAEGVGWIVLTLARALQHAHSRGVLHRDVKPANVLLTFRDGPQLLDFNLAHDPHDAEHAEAALRGGTLPYMAPEQLEAFLDPTQWENVGEAADLYELGLLLRELLTGQRPEAPDPSLPLPRAIRDLLDRRALPQPSLRLTNPTIPHSLDSISARCLAYAPTDRYTSAQALIDDLERFLARRALRHAPNTSKVEVTSNWARRYWPAFVLALAILVVPPLARVVLTNDPNPAGTYVALGEEHLKFGRPAEARKAFERAIQLDPARYPAYQGLARLAFLDGDYAKTHEHLGQAIKVAEAQTPRVSAANLAGLHQMRADASVRRGNQLQRPITLHAFLAAAPLYTAAKPDIDRAYALCPKDESQIRFNIDYVNALAEIGLGDVASAFDNYRESVPHHIEAERLLNEALRIQLDSLPPRTRDELLGMAKGLMNDVQLRLSTDKPKLEEELRREAD